MMVMVKLLAWVGAERQAAERRQWDSHEFSNAMEHIVSEPFDRVTTERARSLLAEVSLLKSLSSPE